MVGLFVGRFVGFLPLKSGRGLTSRNGKKSPSTALKPLAEDTDYKVESLVLLRRPDWGPSRTIWPRFSGDTVMCVRTECFVLYNGAQLTFSELDRMECAARMVFLMSKVVSSAILTFKTNFNCSFWPSFSDDHGDWCVRKLLSVLASFVRL